MSVLGGLESLGHDIADVASSAGHAGVEAAEGLGDGLAGLGHRVAAGADAVLGDRDGVQHQLDASDADVDLRDGHFHQAKEYIMGADGDGSAAADGSYDGSDAGDASYYAADYTASGYGDGSVAADASYGYDASGEDSSNDGTDGGDGN